MPFPLWALHLEEGGRSGRGPPMPPAAFPLRGLDLEGQGGRVTFGSVGRWPAARCVTDWRALPLLAGVPFCHWWPTDGPSC